MIPQNIKSEHIIQAIEEFERSGIPKDRSSDGYIWNITKGIILRNTSFHLLINMPMETN
jgi:hypothetical protein